MSLIATPFGFDTTAAEAAAGIDLSGQRTIVTGGSSGIGVETARALAGAGAACASGKWHRINSHCLSLSLNT